MAGRGPAIAAEDWMTRLRSPAIEATCAGLWIDLVPLFAYSHWRRFHQLLARQLKCVAIDPARRPDRRGLPGVRAQHHVAHATSDAFSGQHALHESDIPGILR